MSSRALSAMFTALSAIRSRSVVIFIAVVMNLRSFPMGCLRARSLMHSSSIFTS